MKKLLCMVIVALGVFGVLGNAQAVLILPGQNLAAGSSTALPAYTIVLPEYTVPWDIDYGGGDHFFGTLKHSVLRDDSDGNLIFTYQVFNDEDSVSGISRMTANNFKGFSTDMFFLGASVDPITVTRDSGLGIGIGWSFETDTAGDRIEAGDNSALLWVKTNARYYREGGAGIIDGETANVNTYGPAVPEPGTMMLLGMGILGLFGLGRKKA